MQMLLKASSELRTCIRNNSTRHSMQANNLRDVQLSIVGGSVCGTYRDKMSRFGQTVNNHPYGVVPFLGEGKANNEIHADFFPDIRVCILKPIYLRLHVRNATIITMII
jgi:hypothetical protein